jgi:hypothetical protein
MAEQVGADLALLKVAEEDAIDEASQEASEVAALVKAAPARDARAANLWG